MHTCMTDLPAFLRREKDSLQYLRDKAATIGNLGQLYLSAANALVRFREDMGMSVLLQWPVLHEPSGGRILWLYVGGLIEQCGNVTNVSHFLCVAQDAPSGETKRILRKYHFDYADPAGKRRRPHPVFHLQYPGSLPPGLASELDDGHMDGWLDEPRVFYGPMSLALVLQMAFWEFPDEYTDRIRKDGYWLGKILRRDQECLWRPFHEGCASLIASNKIVLDEAYGT